MTIEKTPFEGLFILQPKVYTDSRGSFMESFNSRTFQELGIHSNFVQDNQSLSKKGVVRGLHCQRPPYAQAKLVRVLRGHILDIAVDLRKQAPTFGQHFSVELSSENNKQLFIPKGFAHGFVALSDEVQVFYKSDEFYYPEAEAGILFNDPALKIDWCLRPDQLLLSEKDRQLSSFEKTMQFI